MSAVNDNHYPASTSANSISTPTSGRSPQGSSTPAPVPVTTTPGPVAATPTTNERSSSGGPVVPSTVSNSNSNSSSQVSSGSTGGVSSSQGPPLHHPLLGYVPHGNKILSRNLNGTRKFLILTF